MAVNNAEPDPHRELLQLIDRVTTRVVVVVVRELVTSPCDVSDLCAEQRSGVSGYDKSILLSFRFSCTAAFLGLSHTGSDSKYGGKC